MKFKFKRSLTRQMPSNAVVDCFAGQPMVSGYHISHRSGPRQAQTTATRLIGKRGLQERRYLS